MKHRTFWRVYLHGVLLLLLVAVAVIAVGMAFGNPRRGALERMTAWAADEMEPLLADPAGLQQHLDETAASMEMSLAVYAVDGTRLAASGDDPPRRPPGPPPPRMRRARYFAESRIVVAPIGHPPKAVLVGRVPSWSSDWTRPAAAIGAVLLALAIGSIPLARSIASPLEHLTRTVRRFGSGDFSARAGTPRVRGEVGELTRAFDEMAERIETLIRSEKELLANVSHELRTPLARIRIALELAEEGGGRYLREIETDLAELEGMIDDVLAATRLDLGAAGPGGTPPLRRAPFPGAELVETAAARFAALHPDRTLDVRIEGELPVLDGDARLLRRAVANLLDNAAKYSEGAIDLRARAEAGKLVLEVIDRGIGIEAADLPRLFTPFFRTDRSRARGTGGVGLGLALARRIVEAHGGTIAGRSTPNEGTTFRIELPA